VLPNVAPPGRNRLRAFLTVNRTTYIVDPKGVEIDVEPGSTLDVHVPVASMIVEGTMRYRGQPVIGQMHIGPRNTTGAVGASPSRSIGRAASPFRCHRKAMESGT
jgi:hypothetical protein